MLSRIAGFHLILSMAGRFASGFRGGYDTGIIGGSGMRVLPFIVFSFIATLLAACTGSDDGPGSFTAHINGSLNTQMSAGADSLRR